MLTNFFGNSKPINFLVIFSLFFSILIFTFLGGNFSFNFTVIPLFLLLLGIANFIISKNNITFDNSFAFLFFVLLIGFFPKIITTNNILYVNITLFLFLRKVYSLQSSKNVFQKLFDAGLWLGVSFLITPISFLFFIVLYMAVFLHQHITFQKVIIPVLSFIIPIFLYFTYCFWYDISFEITFFELFNFGFSVYNHINYLVSLIFVGTFVLFSILLKTPKTLSVKNTFRRNWILVLNNFMVAVIVVSGTANKNGSEFLYLIFPTAIILANGLELFEKKWWSSIILLLFFIGAVVIPFIT